MQIKTQNSHSTPNLPDAPILAEAIGVSKYFSGVTANDQVSFQLRAGEIHALLGENGAGKSTLASILTGLYSADDGEIRINGQQVQFKSPRDALAHRIGIIHQHFHLVERFTVAENIILGDPRQDFLLSNKTHAMVAQLGKRYKLDIDPAAVISSLSLGERQRVEIIKMLYRNVDVLFLDEPTAVLTPQEVTSLFDTLRVMANEGKAIALVTHKLGEIFSVADSITVMRGGKVVATAKAGENNPNELARLMVGREVNLTPKRKVCTPGDVLLSARGLSLSPRYHCGLHDISMDIRAGEIVGIAGVAGNGQLQLAEALAGLRSLDSGTISVNGHSVESKGPRTARNAGLAYVPEDRLGVGMAAGLSIADNLSLTEQGRWILDLKKSRQRAEKAIEQYDIKCRGPEEIARRLSGGNVQKVLLARELNSGANVYVIASPARGLDVSGIEFVRNMLEDYRNRGAAILLISEDLDELRDLSDHIAVMYAGRIVLKCSKAEFDETKIGLAMAGTAGENTHATN